MKAQTAILCVCVLALLCTAVQSQGILDSVRDAAKTVTDGVNKGVEGVKTGANTVTNATKSGVDTVKNTTTSVADGAKKVGEALNPANIGKKSAAGYAAPAMGMVAAAGVGLLMVL